MSSDSLDWLWEDFYSYNLVEETVDDYLDTINDDNSFTSSNSSNNIDCSLLIRDNIIEEEEGGREGEEEFNDYADDINESIPEIFPESYTKNSNIEKLIVFCAENFIEQFKVKYPDRRQLVLIPQNECGVRKVVCTTIKPSRLVYSDLIELISYSQFVAKHITYVKLKDPLALPNKIVSPATTLKTQIANCFELAILLVSFLIGCGYNAFVIYGYATEIVCNNDLRKIKIDIPKEPIDEQELNSESKEDIIDDPYAVEPMIDLCNDYVNFLMEEEKNEIVVNDETIEIEFENLSDPLFGKRVHAWVMIMPLETEDDTYISEVPYFIEPSTGERKEMSDENYIGIEVVWNHNNYWVNLQPLVGGCTQYNFTLMSTNYWEHFLPDKLQNVQRSNLKSLEMPNSWVTAIEVPINKYLMLYPNGKKIVPYMNAIKEFYADYVMPNGLIKRTTFYTEQEYLNKIFIQEIFKNRVDKLICIDTKYTVKGIETIEYFKPGRDDYLKKHKFYGDCNNIETTRLITFYNLRLDSMAEIKINENSFIITYNDRSDLLFWQLCVFCRTISNNSQNINDKRKPKCVIEKYLRNESKHKDLDIATLSFDLESGTIYVQYQYGEGQITQSSRLFKKPTYSSIKNEKFNPESVIEDIVYPYVSLLKTHEAYIMLQDMIEIEKKSLINVSKLEDNVIQILETRSQERSEFKLKIDSLDWNRNHRIKQLLQDKKDKKYKFAIKDSVASSIRDKIIKHFRQSTKNQFIQLKQLFEKKNLELLSLTKSLESNDTEHRDRNLIMCSQLKNELNILTLKLKRYKESRIRRYNNLATYINSNPDYKMLSPLKLFV
ncbi:LOW QUALITY PROTEIN: dynein regulatory complex subunit 7-like [Melanaphis sacchari]|uniref:LOW QUALITY PROTEIN: dynein regulatory complex subunit 7-like n=1 Tax=Melanaphis sacchari TaxID=742174 RepID=UPI000DC15A90|nr:LOW QUALITY PROTEIN: dynein regulatory complex subunit 7-like [Melanaphis sacchari]